MSPKLLQKKTVEQDVLTLALDRIRRCYELFDTVTVSLSGGKDSTIVLNLAVEVARELGRLPVRTIFWDEECIPLQTEDYLRRVRERGSEIALEWLCLPMKELNACSSDEPWWFPWGPEYEDLWVRPKPDGVIESLPGYPVYPKDDRLFHMTANRYLFQPERDGNAVLLMGIRAAESLMRTRAMLTRYEEAWLHPHEANVNGTLTKAYPIYDWKTSDVWTAIDKFGWDYNEAYDRMGMFGIPAHYQRISSPFHVEAVRGLQIYAAAYSEIYERMLTRVPGAAAAARYGRTELYGADVLPRKPDGQRWKDFVIDAIRRHPEDQQAGLAKRIAGEIRTHASKTADPILPHTPHLVTGVSWEYLLKLAMRGDWIRRHQPHRISASDVEARERRAANWREELSMIRANGLLDEILL